MRSKIQQGEFFKLSNKTIVRIVIMQENCPGIKLRCVRPVKGIHSNNIDLPYTYQRWTTINKFLKQKPIRIGTEELLISIFNHKKQYEDRIEFFSAIIKGEKNAK